MKKNDTYPQAGIRLTPNRLLIAGVATLAIAGGAYNAGQSSQYDKTQKGIEQADKDARKQRNGHILSALRDNKEVQDDIKTLKLATAEEVKSLKDDELFDKATDVQAAILDLSDSFDVNNRDIVESLVPEGTLEAFNDANVHFTYTDEGCLNAVATLAENHQIKEATIPLRADS